MPAYRRGASGQEVENIQQQLQQLGFYSGPLDGLFGGGTESAVCNFQRQKGLMVDGVVGTSTWKELFGAAEVPAPEITRRPLEHRCLALTGTFETGTPVPDCFAGITGDFDGQGLSLGALQWNLGQGSLQPLIRSMVRSHPGLLESVFQDHYPELKLVFSSTAEDQMAWVRSIQNPLRHTVNEPWRGLLKTLGRQPEFQEIQVREAAVLYRQALDLCHSYGLWSQRGVALMFDIKVQNGSISELVRSQIQRDVLRLPATLSEGAREQAVLEIIANRRAEASNPRWVEDVRRRKLAIARGAGVVHGLQFDLEEQFGILLQPFAT